MKSVIKYIYIFFIFSLLFNLKTVLAKNDSNILMNNDIVADEKIIDENILTMNVYKVLDDNNIPANCKSLLGDPKDKQDPAYYINFAFKVLKYIAILVLFVLSTVDMISAIASSDQDIINKTVKKIGVRALLCVVIFVLPTLIEFFLTFLNDSKASLCGIRG